MTPVTNAVLQERQEQQFTQTMVLLAKIDDKLAVVSDTIHQVQIREAGQGLRLDCDEKRLAQVEDKLEAAQKHIWRIVVAAAVLTGAGMAGVDKVLSLIIP